MISHDRTRTVTSSSTGDLFNLLKSKLESTCFGVDKTIPSRARTVSDAIPSKLTPPRVSSSVFSLETVDLPLAYLWRLRSSVPWTPGGSRGRSLLRRTKEFYSRHPETPPSPLNLRRNAAYSRRFIHERVTYIKHVIVINGRTLPRTATKGSVREWAVEDQYKKLLDAVYGAVPKC